LVFCCLLFRDLMKSTCTVLKVSIWSRLIEWFPALSSLSTAIIGTKCKALRFDYILILLELLVGIIFYFRITCFSISFESIQKLSNVSPSTVFLSVKTKEYSTFVFYLKSITTIGLLKTRMIWQTKPELGFVCITLSHLLRWLSNIPLLHYFFAHECSFSCVFFWTYPIPQNWSCVFVRVDRVF